MSTEPNTKVPDGFKEELLKISRSLNITLGKVLVNAVQVYKARLKKDGEIGESVWFDISRLKITSKKPVMEVPDFNNVNISEGGKGPAEKTPMKI